MGPVRMSSSSRRRLRDLPLFVKLLVPFLVLILVIGAGGLYLVVHDLSSGAQSALNEELLRRSLDARSRIHDRELYLLESVNFAANLRGIAGAVEARDRKTTSRVLRSVVALKTDLELLAVVGRDGESIVSFARAAPGGRVQVERRVTWSDDGLIRRTLRTNTGEKTVGFARVEGVEVLAIATPICAGRGSCRPVGVALVGSDIETLAAEAAGRRAGERRPTVALYSESGVLLAKSNEEAEVADAPPAERPQLERRREVFGSSTVETLFSPFEIRGRRVGTLAVGLDASLTFGTVRDSAIRLTSLFFLAIAGVVGIGLLLSRYLLAQVSPLVDTSRELGRGNLAARVPIMGRDELGELAAVLNAMAGELQGSHDSLERRVEERTEQVQRLLEERTEFFTGISHELRTPIAVILSEARMLVDPEFKAERGTAAEAAQVISASAEQLLTRVNDILELARGESGRLEMNVTDVAMDGLLADLASAVSARVAMNSLSFSLETPGGLPHVLADQARLRDAISNLVDNAVKYTPSGGSVTLSAANHEDSITVSVSDTGVGIPPEVGERIFEPFFQVAGTRPQHGEVSSGLGLALAKRSIEAFGGSLTYASVIGAGTTFTIELPIAENPMVDPSKGDQTDRRYARTAKTRRWSSGACSSPNFVKMFRTFPSTALVDRNNCSEMARFERPSAMRASTSLSRGVSSSRGFRPLLESPRS